MKKIVLVLALFVIFIAQAQDKKQKRKMSISLSYPFAVLESGKAINGIANLNYKYIFKNKDKYNFGLSFEFNYAKSDGKISNFVDENYYYHNFNFFRKFDLGSDKKISLIPTVGYTFLASDYYRYVDSVVIPYVETERTKSHAHGFNLGLEGNYTLKKNFFLTTSYKYMTVVRDRDSFSLDFAEIVNSSTFSVGLGYYFK